jgi:hypothetical protein
MAESDSPPPSLRRRSLLHIRVRRGRLGGDILLPVVVLLGAEDADALAEESDAVLRDIVHLLTQNAGQILPSLFFAPPQPHQRGRGWGAGGAPAQRGKGGGGAAAGPPAPAAPLPSHGGGVALGTEAGFAGETAVCIFSTRPVQHIYPVMTFTDVGGSMESAERYVVRLGGEGEDEGDAGAGAGAGGSSSSSAAHERLRGETVAAFQLLVRVTHKARQKKRTETILAGDPSHLEHYMGAAAAAAPQGAGSSSSSSSSSSSAAAAAYASVAAAASERSDRNADLVAAEAMLSGTAGRKRGGKGSGGASAGGAKKGKR